MRKLMLFALVTLVACGRMPTAASSSPIGPMGEGLAHAEGRVVMLYCSPKLSEIRDPRPGIEDSRRWFKVDVGECAGRPVWSVDNDGWIEAWHHDKTGRTAWMAGPDGTYTVTVSLDGATDSMTIEIKN